MKYCLLITAIGIGLNVNAQILNLADSVQLNNASVWGVVSDDGDSLCATTTYSPTLKPHIYMRKINYNNISQQSPLKPLTFDAD